MQEQRGEAQKSLSTGERKFLAYNTQLGGTGHGSTASTRRCMLGEFEASWENVYEDIMFTNNAYFIYLYVYIALYIHQIMGDILNKILKIEVYCAVVENRMACDWSHPSQGSLSCLPCPTLTHQYLAKIGRDKENSVFGGQGSEKLSLMI